MCDEEVKEQEKEINDIDQMREEIRLAEDKYMRALAETENRTKRMQKEKQ